MAEDDLGLPEDNKAAADIIIQQNSAVAVQAYGELASTYRWLLATLVSINGGAIVAVLSANDAFTNEAIVQSCAIFAAGIVAAVLTALWSALGSEAAFALVGETLGYWSLVRLDGIRNKSDEVKIDIKVAKNRKAIRRRVALGLSSLLAFVVGIAVAMSGLV